LNSTLISFRSVWTMKVRCHAQYRDPLRLRYGTVLTRLGP
jgi:hypothetical protein